MSESSTEKFHNKMAEASSRGLSYDPTSPASPEGRNARLIKEGEELMAKHEAERASALASKGKLGLLVDQLKKMIGLR